LRSLSLDVKTLGVKVTAASDLRRTVAVWRLCIDDGLNVKQKERGSREDKDTGALVTCIAVANDEPI
jgi:hypothetical protein